MSAGARYDFPGVCIGDTVAAFSITLTEDGAAMDLTGVTFSLAFDASLPTFTETTLGVSITSNVVSIPLWATAGIAAGEYKYTWVFTFPTGEVKTYMYGKIRITEVPLA